MAYSLIFTSSPMSLTGSRSGFCTVARSAGMSEKLANIVEKFGVYDAEKMGGCPIFEHRKIWFADAQYHVLTRICETRADYTNRSNYIAEHLVLSKEESDLLPSPAQTILNHKWFYSWEGNPRFLDDIKIEKQAQEFAPPAKNWEKIFGDASAAAAIFDSDISIFAANKDGETLLKLFAESSSLQTQKIRAWDFTFSTAISNSDNSSDFLWKAELNPSKDKILSTPKAINLIDKSYPEPSSISLANYAKTGNISKREKLGLKVAKASEFKPKIHIAKNFEEKPSTDWTKITIIAAVAISVAALAIGLYAIFSPSGNTSQTDAFYTPASAQDHQNLDASNITLARDTYSSLRTKIREEIENCNWDEAVQLWDNSNFQSYNPNARAEIFSQIGAKVDELLDSIEQDIAEKNISKQTKSKLSKVKQALKLNDLKNKQKRLARLKNIEGEL